MLASYRGHLPPDRRNISYGFRCVLTAGRLSAWSRSQRQPPDLRSEDGGFRIVAEKP
jgi:hypothetical protein